MSFNFYILISLVIATVYFFYSFFILKNTPQLADIFELMISTVAIATCVFFLIDLTFTEKSLGDYEEHKYILFLGSFAIMWVSGQTILKKFISSVKN